MTRTRLDARDRRGAKSENNKHRERVKQPPQNQQTETHIPVGHRPCTTVPSRAAAHNSPEPCSHGRKALANKRIYRIYAFYLILAIARRTSTGQTHQQQCFFFLLLIMIIIIGASDKNGCKCQRTLLLAISFSFFLKQ